MSRLQIDLAALGSMTRAQLLERWSKVDERPAPNAPASLLRPLVAYRLQERRLGGLPALVRRELMRAAADGGEALPPRRQLSPGTRLVREWNGQTITVEVLEDGYRHADRDWRSLSEIARHVTGSHWSGPRFFGLTSRG